MQSHDTHARQLTTVNVYTACRGFCLSGFYYVVIDQLAEIPKYFLIWKSGFVLANKKENWYQIFLFLGDTRMKIDIFYLSWEWILAIDVDTKAFSLGFGSFTLTWWVVWKLIGLTVYSVLSDGMVCLLICWLLMAEGQCHSSVKGSISPFARQVSCLYVCDCHCRRTSTPLPGRSEHDEQSCRAEHDGIGTEPGRTSAEKLREHSSVNTPIHQTVNAPKKTPDVVETEAPQLNCNYQTYCTIQILYWFFRGEHHQPCVCFNTHRHTHTRSKEPRWRAHRVRNTFYTPQVKRVQMTVDHNYGTLSIRNHWEREHLVMSSRSDNLYPLVAYSQQGQGHCDSCASFWSHRHITT